MRVGHDGARRCALSGVVRPRASLIRFVAGPDGVIVPDLAGRLPGRGVWITAWRQSVDKAARTNVFARSLKRKVAVAPDLSDTVDRLLARRVREALSLASKAGLVVAGFVKVRKALEGEDIAVLLHAADASKDGCKKLDAAFAAISKQKEISALTITILDSEELSLALGRSNVVHAALRCGGASQNFAAAALKLSHYRSDTAGTGGAEVNLPGEAAISAAGVRDEVSPKEN